MVTESNLLDHICHCQKQGLIYLHELQQNVTADGEETVAVGHLNIRIFSYNN